MTVPATTGSLKTSLIDMNIGDYIVCNYTAASDAVGTFSNFGGTAGAEIPITGSATPNGSFYFIKADKGLLVADRIVQHSISWDTLNSGNFIQGRTGGNIIPAMTSNIAPSGTASASSNTANNDPYKAFDQNTTTKWENGISMAAGTIPQWLEYDFGSPKKITTYAITVSNITYQPYTWTFEGWNGTVWIQLDSQTAVPLTNYERKKFVFTNSVSFTKYRLNISKCGSSGTGNWLWISELELFEYPLLIRSLTGGVAYADANGNPSNSSSGMIGAYPTNNEWDKYIVNYPTSKIQSGKVLKDVWNFGNSCNSWTQDTPRSALSTSDCRIGRGYANQLTLNNATSNNANLYYGFRPVFEYIE